MVSKVGAWICCFMLDTSLRQTPNAKRKIPTQDQGEAIANFSKKIFHSWDGELSLYVEDVRWWCWIPDSYFSPGVKTHSLFLGDLHCISKSSSNLTKYLKAFVYRKRSCVSLILKMNDGLEDLENLVAPSSAQLSHLPLILSLIFIWFKILFKIMYQPTNLMLLQHSYPRS